MTFWQNVLNGIMKQEGTPPPHVRALAFDRGVRLTKWELGAAWVTWSAEPQFCNGAGSLFGGYICAVADVVADFTMMTIHADDQVHTTADLRMSFFLPIAPGEIDVQGKVVTRSRHSAHLEIEFRDGNGDLCAKAAVVEAFVKFAPPPQRG